MESIAITLLAIWIMTWVIYCLCVALGMNAWTTLVGLAAYAGWVLVIPPVVYGFHRIYDYLEERARTFQPGDQVVYLKHKYSSHPGRRAELIAPAARGDGYRYVVRKPWTVARVVGDKMIEVITNGEKHHLLRTDDPNLHKAGLLERVILRLRWHKQFPFRAT